MANRIKKGDRVVINTGKDKGKQGEVVRVDGDRVIVSNANVIKRHTSRTRRRVSPAAWSSVKRRSISPT